MKQLKLMSLVVAALFSCTLLASAAGFNAGLDVDRSVNGHISVTVQHSSVLETEVPELAIPCDFAQAYVTLNGALVTSTLADGEIRFPVAKGGTYVIHRGSAPAVKESRIVSAKVSGSTFSSEVLCATAQETAVVAAYGTNGKFLDQWSFTLREGTNSVTQSLAGVNAVTVQIFVLEPGMVPACGSEAVSLH